MQIETQVKFFTVHKILLELHSTAAWQHCPNQSRHIEMCFELRDTIRERSQIVLKVIV